MFERFPSASVVVRHGALYTSRMKLILRSIIAVFFLIAATPVAYAVDNFACDDGGYAEYAFPGFGDGVFYAQELNNTSTYIFRDAQVVASEYPATAYQWEMLIFAVASTTGDMLETPTYTSEPFTLSTSYATTTIRFFSPINISISQTYIVAFRIYGDHEEPASVYLRGDVGCGTVWSDMVYYDSGGNWLGYLDDDSEWEPFFRTTGFGAVALVEPCADAQECILPVDTTSFEARAEFDWSEIDTDDFQLNWFLRDSNDVIVDSMAETVPYGAEAREHTFTRSDTGTSTYTVKAVLCVQGDLLCLAEELYYDLDIVHFGTSTLLQSFGGALASTQSTAWAQAGCDDIGITDVFKGVKCAFIWAFYPSQNSYTAFTDVIDKMLYIPPVGYATLSFDVLADGLSATTSPFFMPTYATTGTGTIAFVPVDVAGFWSTPIGVVLEPVNDFWTLFCMLLFALWAIWFGYTRKL